MTKNLMSRYEVNQCSFPFDEDFKALIKNERESPEVQALKTCKTNDQFQKVQEILRNYLKKKYPTYFKIRFSDMFAFAIALVHPHLDDCTTWEDIKFHCLDDSKPDTGFDWTYNISFEKMKSICVCGHSITASNSYIVYHEDGPLRIVLGSCCIQKSEIVDDFELVQKRRKKHLKKLEKEHIQKQIDTWKNYNDQLLDMHQARIQKQIDTWKNYNDQLMHMHRTRSSCQFCRKNVKAPYKICFGCRKINYDQCDCGKSKQKQYPKCYTCK